MEMEGTRTEDRERQVNLETPDEVTFSAWEKRWRHTWGAGTSTRQTNPWSQAGASVLGEINKGGQGSESDGDAILWAIMSIRQLV